MTKIEYCPIPKFSIIIATEKMQHFKTIAEYCKAINIPPPLYSNFDIRSFEENMKSVVSKMPPFRHEFYAIAIKSDGDGKAISGHHKDFPKGHTIFFNSPFQILSWDIIPNWSGFYIMMSQDFLSNSHIFYNLIENYPFLKIDETIPFEIDTKDLPEILNIYNRIEEEYHSNNEDKFTLIESYVLILLNMVARLYQKNRKKITEHKSYQNSSLNIMLRFENLIKISFYPKSRYPSDQNPHSTSYYAKELNIHPNYLNFVVKNESGQNALKHIHNYIIKIAKSQLMQTKLSIKEISYNLHFTSPNNFSSFFKKQTGLTPLQYRKKVNI